MICNKAAAKRNREKKRHRIQETAYGLSNEKTPGYSIVNRYHCRGTREPDRVHYTPECKKLCPFDSVNKINTKKMCRALGQQLIKEEI